MSAIHPFLVHAYVMIDGVSYAGAYHLKDGMLTVLYEGEQMTVELGVALPATKAVHLLGLLVKRAHARARARR
jgi:hypothetical protein